MPQTLGKELENIMCEVKGGTRVVRKTIGNCFYQQTLYFEICNKNMGFADTNDIMANSCSIS
jgi:hypothetical protein